MDQVRALSLIAASLSLGACTTADVEPAGALHPGAQYVALGSSFAAGAGIGPAQPGSPDRCGRTSNNYASLLAERLDLALDDRGCGGARTDHVLTAWDELPAQINAVGPETRLVTITIGGNDLDYMGLLFSASCDPETGMMVRGEQSACQPRAPLPDEAAYARTQSRLAQIARRINAAAPAAQVVFVQYVTLVPQHPCESIPLDETSAADARRLARRLAAMTAQAAEQSGALVLAADQLSATHTACDSEPWSRGFVADYDGAEGAPWHPTTAGHAAIADALEQMLTTG